MPWAGSERTRSLLRSGRDNTKLGRVWGREHAHTLLLRADIYTHSYISTGKFGNRFRALKSIQFNLAISFLGMYLTEKIKHACEDLAARNRSTLLLIKAKRLKQPQCPFIKA